MTATDELRRLLDERGVEWWQKKRHTCWKVSKGQEVEMWRAWEAPDGSLTLKVDYIYDLTPEQAIAATLGRGMLTADDVRDLIERHSDASGGNGRDFHNGAYVAIADELNATLGSCNCSNNCTNSERTETCEMEYVSDWMSWHCKSCDHMDMAPRNPKPRYCKWCGRKVADA